MISYPSNWISVPGNDGSIMFRAPAESFSDNYVNAAVLVMSESLPSQSNTLQALTEHKLKSYLFKLLMIGSYSHKRYSWQVYQHIW